MNHRIPLLFLATALTMVAAAQNDQLHVKDGQVLYQKVFNGEPDNPLAYLENIRGMSNVRNLNGAIFSDGLISNGALKKGITDSGLRRSATPIFLQNSSVTCQIQLEKREGRFLVTVSEMALEWVDGPFKGDVDNIEVYVLKRSGEVKTKLFQTTKILYDKVFDDLFSPQDTTPSTDDW